MEKNKLQAAVFGKKAKEGYSYQSKRVFFKEGELRGRGGGLRGCSGRVDLFALEEFSIPAVVHTLVTAHNTRRMTARGAAPIGTKCTFVDYHQQLHSYAFLRTAVHIAEKHPLRAPPLLAHKKK